MVTERILELLSMRQSSTCIILGRKAYQDLCIEQHNSEEVTKFNGKVVSVCDQIGQNAIMVG